MRWRPFMLVLLNRERARPAKRGRPFKEFQWASGPIDGALDGVLGLAGRDLGLALGFLDGALGTQFIVAGRLADSLLCLAGNLVRLTGNLIAGAAHIRVSPCSATH